jgi:hypothetical protein
VARIGEGRGRESAEHSQQRASISDISPKKSISQPENLAEIPYLTRIIDYELIIT